PSRRRAQEDLAAAGVFHEVLRELGGDDPRPADRLLVGAEVLRERHRPAARVPRAAGVEDLDPLVDVEGGHGPLQRTIEIVVPPSTRLWMSNACTSRRAPPRPRPRPDPVVKPSESARSMSGMPGP